LPQGYAIVICNTNVERALAASAYNERRAQCEEAVRILSRYAAALRALRDVTPEFLMQHADDLPSVVLKRAQHVVGEIARVRYAVRALRDGRIDRLGQAMRASHESLRDLYEVSCPELDALVDAALDLDGAQVVGARLTGAGFGGCAVSLVREDALERFLNEVPVRYRMTTGIEAELYVCAAADGASVISAS
jgi:galactokinase